MNPEDKTAIEAVNVFGTGAPNTAYAKFLSAIPSKIR